LLKKLPINLLLILTTLYWSVKHIYPDKPVFTSGKRISLQLHLKRFSRLEPKNFKKKHSFQKQIIKSILGALHTLKSKPFSGPEMSDITFTKFILKNTYREAAFLQPRTNRVPVTFRRLFDPDLAYADLTKVKTNNLPHNYNAWVIYAVNRQLSELPDWWTRIVMYQGSKNGYSLTHRYIALRMQKYCFPAYTFPKDFYLAMTMLLKQIKNKIPQTVSNTDLLAEQLALVISAGQYGLEIEKKIRLLLEQQRDDGLWVRRPRTGKANAHTTYLCLWALTACQVLQQYGPQGITKHLTFHGIFSEGGR